MSKQCSPSSSSSAAARASSAPRGTRPSFSVTLRWPRSDPRSAMAPKSAVADLGNPNIPKSDKPISVGRLSFEARCARTSRGRKQRRLLVLFGVCVRVDHVAGLEFRRPKNRLFAAGRELLDIIRRHVLKLSEDRARLRPFAVLGEGDFAGDGLKLWLCM